MITSIFVYGTLKRGQLRASQWPRAPLDVASATTRGRLYDLGGYPALLPGDDLIAGEVWRMLPEDIDATLRVLDQIEGYDDSDDDLYKREIVACRVADGHATKAFTYYFARPLPEDFRVLPNSQGHCIWNAANK